jgi:nitrogenase molybdenum-iron protein beta chain
MTEDAAVFGGNNNMNLGLQNASALYKPEIIAVSTTCMAEVIGDDLQAFIANAKKMALSMQHRRAARPYAKLYRQPRHRLGQYV